MTQRRKIPLSLEEDAALRHLYRHFRVPVDQFSQRPTFSRRFLQLFNEATGRDDSLGDLIHYMRTLRKKGRWETFSGSHEPLRCPPADTLTEEEWEIVNDEYVKIGVASDNFAYDPAPVRTIRERLVRETGTTVTVSLLTAAIVARRKAGLLPRLPSDGEPNQGFGDIDAV